MYRLYLSEAVDPESRKEKGDLKYCAGIGGQNLNAWSFCMRYASRSRASQKRILALMIYLSLQFPIFLWVREPFLVQCGSHFTSRLQQTMLVAEYTGIPAYFRLSDISREAHCQWSKDLSFMIAWPMERYARMRNECYREWIDKARDHGLWIAWHARVFEKKDRRNLSHKLKGLIMPHVDKRDPSWANKLQGYGRAYQDVHEDQNQEMEDVVTEPHDQIKKIGLLSEIYRRKSQQEMQALITTVSLFKGYNSN